MTDRYDYDLGAHRRRVSTLDRAAQTWFDRGLVWCYGFNHEEAIRCFERAIDADPGCAMAHWGVAYAVGPNYNKPWDAFDDDDRRRSLDRARAAIAAAQAAVTDPCERGLIDALAARYPPTGAVEQAWSDAYADRMRDLHAAHPGDDDIATLCAEALMTRTPWALWDIATGQPAVGADTLEAAALLESAMARRAAGGLPAHPGLAHMYVHLMELSPHPERALDAADSLRGLVPDAGHLEHMPTHIDVLCGRYAAVVEGNERAIVADRRFLAREGPANFYSLYRCHDYHFKLYGAMFLGRFAPALEAAEELVETLPEEVLRVTSPPLADWLEGFVPMVVHVLVRFGRFAEVIDLALPQDPDLYCVTTAMIHYGRGVAHAALGDVEAGERERSAFVAAADRVPASRTIFNNTCRDILAIAGAMLDGEIAYRARHFDEAFAHLRRSVELDDSLPYDEPWGWMQPTRHALGALLLEQGHVEEAESVYRADLGLGGTLPRACQHPDNVWSLHGLHECLMRRDATAEAVAIATRLEAATAAADVTVTSSCFCRRDRPV